jgi:rod shape-determining protein MreD
MGTNGRLVRWARIVGVVVGALAIQLAVISDLPAWGAVGDLMLVLALAAASVAPEPSRGALAGFAIGLVYDLMLGTPFGLTALVYAVVCYGVSAVSTWFAEPPAWFYVVLAPAAGVVAVVTTVGVALTLDLSYPAAGVVRIAAVVATWNGLLILPLRRLMQWALRSKDTDTFWVAVP